MEFFKKNPVYLILIVVALIAIWKLPEAINQSEEYNNSRPVKELDEYLEVKGQALGQKDSLEVNQFYATLAKLHEALPEAGIKQCSLKELTEAKEARVMDKALLDFVFKSRPAEEKEFFKKVSTLNSQNPFPRVNLSLGDGFTDDLADRNWHKGLHSYISHLKADRILFIATIEQMKKPQYLGERNFIEGECKVGIWACDLIEGRILGKNRIIIDNDDSRGLPLKTEAMNQKLYLELLEKSVVGTQDYCTNWLTK